VIGTPSISGGCSPRLFSHRSKSTVPRVGFEQEYAAQMFEPFRRLHGAGIPGSGIALATCKRIIERLGEKSGQSLRPEKVRRFTSRSHSLPH
jgi:light-regulated signal transduction histidine kinase (bacteriophytochrome)